MPLNRQDALRLLHFCLGPDDSGSVDLADDGAALVTVAPAESPAGVAAVRTFEAATFDEALRQAADAGMLKAACVEKQIAFLSREGDREARTTPEPAPVRPPPRDLFPRLVTATASLLHELQVERGMSAICAASSGRHFRRELPRQRQRVDGRRERLSGVRRELAEPLGGTLVRRLEKVDTHLRAVIKARAALDEGGIGAPDVVATYSAAALELLGIGDGALVAFAAGAQHAGALAAVALLYAKEKTGIERARMGAAFAARSFSDEDRQALAALVSAGRSYLHIFSATAPRPAEELLARALASTVEADLGRAEQLILEGREDETDLDARGWFNLTSRKIELLSEVGAATLGLLVAG
ncbi:MAG TPA: nitrate- and nitrite sensing domain-containing protein [Polyangia bacterium]|nr:nitrate- and nitrite sensing domain-containing protein [Polyangia bacterium]